MPQSVHSSVGAERDDGETSIGVPGVAAAVMPLKLGVETVLPLDRLHHASLLQLGHEAVTLGVDVGSNVMGHLSGRVAEPDTSVVGRRAEPGLPPLIELVPQPEADMVPL